MRPPTNQVRYHATSMELAAYLEQRYVEMRIRTDAGQSVVVVCPRDSIFAIKRHIEQIGQACPEIATWRTATQDNGVRADDRHAWRTLELAEMSTNTGCISTT